VTQDVSTHAPRPRTSCRTYLEGLLSIMPQRNSAVRESEAKKVLPPVVEEAVAALEELSVDELPLPVDDPRPVVEPPPDDGAQGRASGMLRPAAQTTCRLGSRPATRS
jgi:hypothetical protein